MNKKTAVREAPAGLEFQLPLLVEEELTPFVYLPARQDVTFVGNRSDCTVTARPQSDEQCRITADD